MESFLRSRKNNCGSYKHEAIRVDLEEHHEKIPSAKI